MKKRLDLYCGQLGDIRNYSIAKVEKQWGIKITDKDECCYLELDGFCYPDRKPLLYDIKKIAEDYCRMMIDMVDAVKAGNRRQGLQKRKQCTAS